MTGDLIQKKGVDTLGRNYTRNVKAPTAPSAKSAARTGSVGVPAVSQVTSVGQAAESRPTGRTQPPARVRLTRNNAYIDRIFATEPDERRFETLDTTREVGVHGTVLALQDCARDNIGRELTRDELAAIVNEHLWDVSNGGRELAEVGSDRVDFNVIDNMAAVNAFEAVRKLGDNYMDY